MRCSPGSLIWLASMTLPAVWKKGLFNDSLELLDIAGPVAAVEEFHGLVGKRLCRHAVTGRHFRKDMVGNDFHIFHPLPQGRYPDDGANDQFIEALGKEAFIGQTFSWSHRPQ